MVKEEGVGQAPVDEQIRKKKEALINHDLLEEKLEQRKDDLNNDLKFPSRKKVTMKRMMKEKMLMKLKKH